MTVGLIDLRSDTVTSPTPEMRRALAAAEVGDDVFGEDPTVNALEERAAELLGKQAGLLVTSGTQGNLVSLIALVPRGGEVVAERQSHIATSEGGNHAIVVGVSIQPLRALPSGEFDLAELQAALHRSGDVHEAQTALIALENTHCVTNGAPLSAGYTEAVGAIASSHGVALHVDGARLFNAAVALGVSAAELVRPADSATFCLSKGLACPVGSVVVGSREVVQRARRARKLLGGGMRQAGIIAAAGLVALREGTAGMIERLREDHANARRLADGLGGLEQVVEVGLPRTNFCLFALRPPTREQTRETLRTQFLAEMRARGVLMVEYPAGEIRAVTHYGISADDIDRALAAAHAALVSMGLLPAAFAISARR